MALLTRSGDIAVIELPHNTPRCITIVATFALITTGYVVDRFAGKENCIVTTNATKLGYLGMRKLKTLPTKNAMACVTIKIKRDMWSAWPGCKNTVMTTIASPLHLLVVNPEGVPIA